MICKIIKASAGTGKTYSMAIEFLNHINNGVNIDEIVAITFTKKATYEIKQRIYNFLKSILTNDDNSEDIIKSMNTNINMQNLKNAYEFMIKNSESIRIYTIDSLFSQIFKNIILPYKNIYNYEIKNENSYEYINKILYEIITNKQYLEVFDSYYKLENFTSIDDFSKSIKEMIESKEKCLKYESVDIKCQEYEKIVDDIFEYLDNSGVKYDLNKFGKSLKEKKDLRKEKTIGTVLSKKGNKEFAEEFNDQIFPKRFMPLIADYYLKKDIQVYNDIYFKMANICISIDEKLKFMLKEFTISDIEYYTSKYIENKDLNAIENGVVTQNFLDSIGGNIKCLMIDEFQDTSPSQFRLLLPIIKSVDNLLIVGDIKQAIYSFRGGDSTLLTNIKDILNDSVDDIQIIEKELNTCYRSRENIIEFVNDNHIQLENYTKVIAKKDGGYVYAQNDYTKESIVDLIEKNNHFSNTAIIVNKNDEIAEFEKILSDRKIPYIAEQTSFIEKNKSISSILKLIDYLVEDNIYSLLEFLRSDYCKYTLDQIKDFIQGKTNIEQIENIRKNTGKFKKVFLDNFGYGCSEISEDIININKFLDLIDTKINLFEFKKFYDKNKTSLNKENIFEKKGVTLITAFKAKGLEFDNAYVMVNRKDKDPSIYKFVYKRDKFSNITSVMRLKRFKFYEYSNYCSDLIKEYRRQESETTKNVLYVAYTRAKNNMYIFDNDLDYTIGDEYVYENENTKLVDNITINTDLFNETVYTDKICSESNIIMEQKRKIGLATHYFMQYLKNEDDIQYAKSMLCREYGNLIGINDTKSVINRCINFMKQNPNIFSNKYLIYTEYEIYDENNKKYIIDRMNIDMENKKIFIYDYKTLKDPEKNEKYNKQIENYKKIIEKLNPDFEINTCLLSI